ncbi:MAG TPA: DinB family protein [Mucilaginibacter sp.]|jgi:hypothetical protein|nr:DinB family protein [Mucilaginibacter sp.]
MVMNLLKERKAIDEALDNYRGRLDAVPDELFAVTPKEGEWSFAEVYSHILQTTLGSSIALERCANNNCKPTNNKLTFFGHFIMFTGRFPPIKVKVPEAVSARMPASKIDKEEAKNLLIKCRKRIEELAPLVKGALPSARHKHPRLGALDAKRWFKFIRIHLQHHLKQLDRLQKKFKNA